MIVWELIKADIYARLVSGPSEIYVEFSIWVEMVSSMLSVPEMEEFGLKVLSILWVKVPKVSPGP